MFNQIYFNDINIDFCGIEFCGPGHTYGPGFRETNILHFVLSGNGCFFMDGKSYSLTKGDGFYFPKDAVVTYVAEKHDPWLYVWFAFSDEYTGQCLENAGITRDCPVFRRESPEVLRRAEELKNVLISGANQYAVMGKVCDFIADLTEGAKPGSVQDEYIKKASEYMKFNLYSGTTIADAAAYAGIDKSYLNKLFKEKKGISPVDYLINLKMDEAVRLMKNPMLRICDIASNVGYSDQFVFSKAFAKKYGMSPSTYRKKII